MTETKNETKEFDFDLKITIKDSNEYAHQAVGIPDERMDELLNLVIDTMAVETDAMKTLAVVLAKCKSNEEIVMMAYAIGDFTRCVLTVTDEPMGPMFTMSKIRKRHMELKHPEINQST